MKIKGKAKIKRAFVRRRSMLLVVMLLFGMTVCNIGGCVLLSDADKTYYGRVKPPGGADFRWSNGGLPQQFDPARAATPPDTDAVRALCEGLTNYDPRTLAAIPGVAERWESSPDKRVWTMYLRQNARWSNGEAVTAQDFVRSWQRVAALGDQAPHGKLLENISGLHGLSTPPPAPQFTSAKSKGNETLPDDGQHLPAAVKGVRSVNRTANKKLRGAVPAFGADALSDYVLRVHLLRPDANFPALVAHPVFCPVREERQTSATTGATQSAVLSPLMTNGAFRLAAISKESIVLERAQNYWDAAEVKLQHVHFVTVPNAESALAAYRAGEVDAVTNAGFEPLALKMLAPFKDFRRATYGALTFYSVNTAKPPYDDVRVRRALALAIDRERLSEDEMNGATEPAGKFLPAQLSGEHESAAGTETNEALPPALGYDIEAARKLFFDAGFPQGRDFPRVRLLVNRNDQQRVIAQAVAAMWETALGINTEVIVKDWDAYEAALAAGDYDVARRGVVMQTPDETFNLREMLEPEIAKPAATMSTATKGSRENAPPALIADVTTEASALRKLPAIPLYFASSYSLIKPYVNGFDANPLDAPSLKRVRIDTDWQMPQKSDASLIKTTN